MMRLHARTPMTVAMMATALSCTPTSANPRLIASSGIASPPGYSQAVAARGAMVYTSGQASLDAQGNVVGVGNMRAQAEQVFANVKVALAAADTDYAHLVKLTVFMTDLSPENVLVFRQVRDRFLDPAHPPANTLVQVAKLTRPELMIEMEAIAVIP